jgi:MYXO-CTERM domain-containing protein
MNKVVFLAVCGGALSVLTGQAAADIIGNPITVTVQNENGTGSFNVTLAECGYDANSQQWFYIQQGSRVVLGDSGRTIATFSGLSMFMAHDPAISLGFALQAGGTPTLVTISSALLTFPTLTNPTAHSSAGMSITDNSNDGTGVTMTGNYGNFAYRADYNGLVPAGSLYSLHNPNFFSAGDGTSNSESGNNNAPIAGNVSSMSASWSFVISASDSVSGTSNFTVLPAPGAMGLLGIGSLVLTRRRR